MAREKDEDPHPVDRHVGRRVQEKRLDLGLTQTALAALHEAGLDIPMSCEQGICGTCLTGVKAGKPDHRDQYLTPEEREACDQFLPCCSRASSARLVLDL